MNSTPLRRFLRAGSIAGAAVFLGAVLNLSRAVAQDAHPAPHPDSTAAKAPDRARIEEVLKGLSRGRVVGQLAVSPDGKRLGWMLASGIGGVIVLRAMAMWGEVLAIPAPGTSCSSLTMGTSRLSPVFPAPRRHAIDTRTRTTSPRRQFIVGSHFGPIPILGKLG